MINWRLYRVGLLPVLLALAVAAFSLGARPAPLGSSLAPDAFAGGRAFAELGTLVARFPQRRPGSAGDDELASYVAARLRALGGTSGGGFQVRVHSLQGQTIDGKRELLTVVAERPGVGGGSPIVILAHRDAAARGSEAELSGTVVLLELARVLADSETQRTIVLVSSSGGSGGSAGARDFASSEPGPFDAAIALGDLAGARVSRPVVVPYSDGLGGAPDILQRTVAHAVAQEVGIDPGGLSVTGQLAHLVFPLTVGEQGPLDAAGVPAVLLQASGERGPGSREALSASDLQRFGSAALGSIYALDAGPELHRSPSPEVLIQRKVIPAWAIRLTVGALLIAPLLVALDALARLHRRREALGWPALWAISLGVPFLLCALFTRLLGLLGIVAAPGSLVPTSSLPLDRTALEALLAVVLLLVGAWLLWLVLVRRIGASAIPTSGAYGISSLLVLVGVSIVTWAVNPFAALLLVPALHLWLPLFSVDPREARLPAQRIAGLALVALAMVPLGLVLTYYARALGMGPGELAWSAMLLLSGGQVGAAAAVLWSLALGSLVASVAVVLAPSGEPEGPPRGEWEAPELSTRGPLGYAGPGSLGGTESALRR